MIEAVAVIGGGYGDEGKGHMVDYWASVLNDPIVVRFNGGAQAGHGVMTPGGRWHVFSHFGAGTFLKVPTFLSNFFVVNPTLFRKEHEAFVKEWGINPEIYVDPQCYVTTPVEMLINQHMETQRGSFRHGSCGTGFGETFERVKRTRRSRHLEFWYNLSHRDVRKEIKGLVVDYLMKRIDLTEGDTLLKVIQNDKLIDDFIEDFEYFYTHTIVTGHGQPAHRLFSKRNLIFEGAQGLELDQDYGHFPYVTRSNCGMKNVTKLINRHGLDLGLDRLSVNYVTRAYKTRHGAGPLPFERQDPFPYKDRTNVYNEWQHGLRWAPFDYDQYKSITDKDFALYANDHNFSYKVRRLDTMNCLDQVEPRTHMETFYQPMFDFFGYGPHREDIEPTRS